MQTVLGCWVAAIAQWIRVRLPSCGPGFGSQTQHLCLDFCLRPKAKDLEITRVVVVVVLVGFFVSKTHATSLSLSLSLHFYYFFFLFNIFYHHIYLSFYYTCLPTQAYQSRPTNLGLPTQAFLSMFTYQCLPTYVYLSTSTYLPTQINILTYL